jgi:hypothetical protein
MPLYFGADGSNMGSVVALPVTSFAQFVKEQLGHPAMLNVTREEFHAMPKDKRNATKRVPFFVPATFASSPSRRAHESAGPCNLIAIDIDDENVAMAKVYARTPQALHEALDPFAFAAYLTVSSTLEAPRMRIVVRAEGIPPASYPEAVRSVAKLLGLPKITQESLVAVQPMYLPTLFAGEDLLGVHPLLTARPEGEAFEVKHIKDADIALASRTPLNPEEATADDLEFLAAPVDEVTLSDMESAVASLDPDMPYMEWLEVAAALRHQFPKDPEAAYAVFDAWSAKGTKYAGAEDTKAKWQSLRQTPRGRKPVTARTLLFRAAAAGWVGAGKISVKMHKALTAWLDTPGLTSQQLMVEAPRRIAAAPMLSQLERADLLSILHGKLKEAGLKISSTDLRKEMHRIAKLAFAPAETVKSAPESQLPGWAKGCCYVAGQDVFFFRQGDRRYAPDVLNNMYNVYLMPQGGNDSGKPSIFAKDYLLNVVRIPRVDQFSYDPANAGLTFITDPVTNTRFVNTYRPTYPEPDEKGAAELGALIEAHVHNLFDQYAEMLLSYLCFIVQNPGRKIRWSPLIQGAPGCGKTLLAMLLKAVLGPTNVRLTDADQLFRNYNGWAEGAQVVAFEEVRVVGHNRHQVMNRLKPVITNDEITIEEKYIKASQAPNITNYILLTNYQDALALTPDDRRYFVLFARYQTEEQVAELGRDYFRKLFGAIDHSAPQLRHWMLSRPICDEFDPDAHAPRTIYRNEMVGAASSPIAVAIREALDDSTNPLITEEAVSLKALTDWLSAKGIREGSGQSVTSVLREFGFRSALRSRLPDGRHSFWVKRGSEADTDASAAVSRMISEEVGDESGIL